MGILSPVNFGNPSFTGGGVDCISEVELWVNRYQSLAGSQQICYQPQGGAVVCVEGDSYQMSNDQPDNFQGGQVINADYIVRVTAATGGQTGIWQFTWPYGGYFKGKITNLSKNSYFDNQGRPYSRVRIIDANGNREIYENGLGGFYSGSFHYWQAHTNYQFEIIRADGTSLLNDIAQGNPQYKIEVFKNSVKVHEHTSSNPISAWSETSSDKCIEGNWQKESSWVQLPFDNLKVKREGDVIFFWLQRGLLTSPVAIIRKKDDCKMPLYKLIVKPKWGCKDDNSKPKECPAETAENFKNDGFLCCYNKEGKLIKSIKL